MYFRLFYTKPFHQPSVLLGRKRRYIFACSWPHKASGFKSLIQKNKSVAFPIQCFYPIPSSAAEQKQYSLERIHLKLRLYYSCKTVYSSSQVCISAGYVYRAIASEVIQHDLSASNIVLRVLLSAPW